MKWHFSGHLRFKMNYFSWQSSFDVFLLDYDKCCCFCIKFCFLTSYDKDSKTTVTLPHQSNDPFSGLESCSVILSFPLLSSLF